MEMSATIRAILLLLVLTPLMVGARVDAQDVVKVSPETVKVILENDQVRVIESTIPPGTLQGKHSHPATIVYYLTASRVRSEAPDGKLVVTERKAGEVAYRVAHAFIGKCRHNPGQDARDRAQVREQTVGCPTSGADLLTLSGAEGSAAGGAKPGRRLRPSP
jgi:hypothetical protein